MKVAALASLVLSSLATLTGARDFQPRDRHAARFGLPVHHDFRAISRPWHSPPRALLPQKNFQSYPEQLVATKPLLGFSIDGNANIIPEQLPVLVTAVPEVQSAKEQTATSTSGPVVADPAADDLPRAPATTEPATMLAVIPPLNASFDQAAPRYGTGHEGGPTIHPRIRSGASVAKLSCVAIWGALLAASLVSSA